MTVFIVFPVVNRLSGLMVVHHDADSCFLSLLRRLLHLVIEEAVLLATLVTLTKVCSLMSIIRLLSGDIGLAEDCTMVRITSH